MPMNPLSALLDRRQVLGLTAHGLIGIALASLLAHDGLLAEARSPIRPIIDTATLVAAR